VTRTPWPESPSGPLRIAIVEDHELLAQRRSCALLSADEMAEQLGGPDVALVDLRLPDIDGIQVVRDLKAKHADTAVIMITAFASAETAVEAMKEGAYDFVTSLGGKVVGSRRVGIHRIYEALLQDLTAPKFNIPYDGYWTTSPVRYRILRNDRLAAQTVENPRSVFGGFGGRFMLLLSVAVHVVYFSLLFTVLGPVQPDAVAGVRLDDNSVHISRPHSIHTAKRSKPAPIMANTAV
jgi:CheY-like chemotaxis protein